MADDLFITTQTIPGNRGEVAHKVTIELPDGTPSAQLQMAMKVLERKKKVPDLDSGIAMPLVTKESATHEGGNYQLTATVSDTKVTMTHFKHGKRGVGATIILEQPSPMKADRLQEITHELSILGVEALEAYTGPSIARQLDRTATSDRAQDTEGGGRMLRESRAVKLTEISRA
jgi:hypothetical protein